MNRDRHTPQLFDEIPSPRAVNVREQQRAGRDIGMDRAQARAEREADEWYARAKDVALEFIRTHRGETFTFEQIRLAHPEIGEPPEKRAWGPIARSIAITGRIVKTGRVVDSNDPNNHCRPNAEWRIV